MIDNVNFDKRIKIIFSITLFSLLMSTLSVFSHFLKEKNWQFGAMTVVFLCAGLFLFFSFLNAKKRNIYKSWVLILYGFLLIYIGDELFLAAGPIYLTLSEFILIAFCAVMAFRNDMKKIFLTLLLYNAVIFFANFYEPFERAELFSVEILKYYQPFITLFFTGVFFFIVLFNRDTSIKVKMLLSFTFVSIMPLVVFSWIVEHVTGYFYYYQTAYAFLITLVLTIILILVSQSIALFITKPLSQLTEKMIETAHDGKFVNFNIEQTSNEMGVLNTTYNSMMSKMTTLISNLENEVEERKKIQEQLTNTVEKLTQSESNFRSISENAKDLIWKIGKDRKFYYVNPAAEEMFGYNQKEFMSLKIEDLCTESSMEFLNLLSQKIDSLESMGNMINDQFSLNLTLEQVTKEKKLFWADISVTVNFDERGLVKDIIGITRNFDNRMRYEKEIKEINNELQKANQELQTLDQMKSYLLSNVSHELRNPLASVMGYTQMLLDEISGPLLPKQRNHLNIMYKNVTHLNMLIEDLLCYSRLFLKKVSLEEDVFDIVDLGNEVVKTLKLRVDEKKIGLNFSFSSSKLEVYGDRKRFKQVFINLLDNAIKFSANFSEIDFSINEIDNNEIEVSIKDYGAGIDIEFIDEIFEVFYQIDTSTTRQNQGLGLGLSMVKKILDMHGIEIKVESQKRKGSKFYFNVKKHTA
ncbi:MAG: ATP-binding protein [Candidatus Muiribacteriota bacterium]